ncbi:MAG: hypothetical protein WDW36_001042 [Sanguina aurantia]
MTPVEQSKSCQQQISFGHTSNKDALYVECLCKSEHTDDGILTLEDWVLEHAGPKKYKKLNESQELAHCLRVVQVREADGSLVTLGQHCRSAAPNQAVDAYPGLRVLVLWYNEVMGPEFREACDAGLAFPADGDTTGSGLGVWYAADVVRHHPATSELEVVYPADQSTYRLLLPLCFTHFGATPPPPQGAPLQLLPLPLAAQPPQARAPAAQPPPAVASAAAAGAAFAAAAAPAVPAAAGPAAAAEPHDEPEPSDSYAAAAPAEQLAPEEEAEPPHANQPPTTHHNQPTPAPHLHSPRKEDTGAKAPAGGGQPTAHAVAGGSSAAAASSQARRNHAGPPPQHQVRASQMPSTPPTAGSPNGGRGDPAAGSPPAQQGTQPRRSSVAAAAAAAGRPDPVKPADLSVAAAAAAAGRQAVARRERALAGMHADADAGDEAMEPDPLQPAVGAAVDGAGARGPRTELHQGAAAAAGNALTPAAGGANGGGLWRVRMAAAGGPRSRPRQRCRPPPPPAARSSSPSDGTPCPQRTSPRAVRGALRGVRCARRRPDGVSRTGPCPSRHPTTSRHPTRGRTRQQHDPTRAHSISIRLGLVQRGRMRCPRRHPTPKPTSRASSAGVTGP